MSKITPPWTDGQVARLNTHQVSGRFHPFTCGSGDRSDGAHNKRAAELGLPAGGLLVATKDGWVCPACGYRQTWAHDWMADPQS